MAMMQHQQNSSTWVNLRNLRSNLFQHSLCFLEKKVTEEYICDSINICFKTRKTKQYIDEGIPFKQ